VLEKCHAELAEASLTQKHNSIDMLWVNDTIGELLRMMKNYKAAIIEKWISEDEV